MSKKPASGSSAQQRPGSRSAAGRKTTEPHWTGCADVGLAAALPEIDSKTHPPRSCAYLKPPAYGNILSAGNLYISPPAAVTHDPAVRFSAELPPRRRCTGPAPGRHSCAAAAESVRQERSLHWLCTHNRYSPPDMRQASCLRPAVMNMWNTSRHL